MRTRVALLCCTLLWAGALAAQRTAATERYDPIFRKYTKRNFGPGFDWRVFKAQGMVESNLDPAAQSGVGARGIMQLMPSTFQSIQSRSPALVSIDDPEWNIAAGIMHSRALWRLWIEPETEADRRSFMFGSYNAGRATILRAQAAARARSLDERSWASIEAVAPVVPRWRHDETLGYVRKIQSNLEQLDEKGRLIRPVRTPP